MLFNSEIVCRFVVDCTRSSNVNYILIVLAQWNTKPHLMPLYHIFLNPCKLFFLLIPLFCELSREAPNTNIIVFGLNRTHNLQHSGKARYPLLPLGSVIIRTKNPMNRVYMLYTYRQGKVVKIVTRCRTCCWRIVDFILYSSFKLVHRIVTALSSGIKQNYCICFLIIT